jgi:hypothetical protein
MPHAPAQPAPPDAPPDDIAPPPFDMTNPFEIPAYKNDVDWTEAVVTQFRLIRGPLRKLRAIGIILLRLLP